MNLKTNEKSDKVNLQYREVSALVKLFKLEENPCFKNITNNNPNKKTQLKKNEKLTDKNWDKHEVPKKLRTLF